MADQPESAVVTFNCQTNKVSVNKDKFTVQQGNTLILTMTLQTNGGSCTAAFPPGGQAFDFPAGGPPGFHVSRNSDTEVVLTETNSNSSHQGEEYCFKAVVSSSGTKFQSPDPTILNQGGG